LIINGLTITVLGMLIVFGFLLLLVATMFVLNIALKKFMPGLLREKSVDQAQPSSSDAEVVAAVVASISARIAANRG
jgi:sodium pump decarboxylase gamma subunit